MVVGSLNGVCASLLVSLCLVSIANICLHVWIFDPGCVLTFILFILVTLVSLSNWFELSCVIRILSET